MYPSNSFISNMHEPKQTNKQVTKFMAKVYLSCKLSLLRMRLAIALLLFLLPLCFTSEARASITQRDEVLALEAVKWSLNDPMKNLSNWGIGDPCNDNWTGVFCYNQTLDDGYLHLWKLQLMNMKLSGTLSPELGKLSHLVILNFMWNEIGGTIPEEIGSLRSLKLLLLSGNQLTGALPDKLGDLPSITRMQINLNRISGPLPKSFANLNKLSHFHLNNNSISGEIPSELSRLPSLVHFVLDNNNLSGSLPEELSKMPVLKILQLDNNNFIGSGIPSSYGNMTKLLKLSLRNCNLQGSIPDFSKIANLSYIDLSMNQLLGPIPSQKLSDKMTTLILSHNYLTGSIPASFSTLPRLQKLDLRYNKLTQVGASSNLPKNVTLLLEGNPLCLKTNITETLCGSESLNDTNVKNDTYVCSYQDCPYFYEYAPKYLMSSCYCALPLIVSFRLEGPGFSYFFPYQLQFETFLASTLGLNVDQLSLVYIHWQEGPRLYIRLKLFPVYDNATNNQIFNMRDVQRIWRMFSEWMIPNDDVFGPYELLNFTLLDPYLDVAFNRIQPSSRLSNGELSAIIVGTFVVTVITSLIISKQLRKYIRTLKRHQSSVKVNGVKRFTYKEMTLATNNFSSCSEVGQGGYGKVYKGVLDNGEVVAIKRAKQGSLQGNKEFCTETELLSRVHHKHLVSLVGYCDDKGEQMLVYEFMPNGTLSDHLSAASMSKQTLSFTTRLRIAIESACGILYLHTEADPPVFHRDIKASNILLDSKFTAKVADFGLSKLAPEPNINGTVPYHMSTIIKGTPGYMDPEYCITHMFTDKSDIYSLGVVFLELLTSMQPISHGKNIVREVNMAYKSGDIISIVDEQMGVYSHKCAERFASLALRCCNDEVDVRPCMIEVVRELEAIIMQTVPESDTILTMEVSFNNLTKVDSPNTSSTSNTMTIPSSGPICLSESDLVSGTSVFYSDPR